MSSQLPVETKFSQFLRHGGKSEFVVRLYPRPFEKHEQKSDVDTDATMQRFHDQIRAEATRVRNRIIEAIKTYAPDTNLDIAFDPSVEIETWMDQFRARLSNDPAQSNEMEVWVRHFGAELNQKWQFEIGVKLYIWRSKDDDEVRSSHAKYDDQIFSWAEPPEGGHPGQDYNCRCWAEPVIVNQYGGNRYLAAQELFDHLLAGEGNIPHMYLDTVRLVTVGKGIQLESVQEAARYDFRDKNTGEKATREQLKQDFNAVRGHYKLGGGRDNNIPATGYAHITQLRLSQHEIDRIALDYLRVRATNELLQLFPDYDDFPLPAQVALMDMIYNLGKGGLSRYPSMRRAIDNRDWVAAAKESGRNIDDPAFDTRNEWTYNLFIEAARIQAQIDG